MRNRLSGILLVLLLVSASANADDYPISIESRPMGDDVLVIVHNHGYSPVSIKASLSEMVNVTSDHDWPIFKVVQANSSSVLAKVFAADKVKDIGFKTSMNSIPGQFDAIHDPATLYRLPYQNGESYSISQAIGGPKTTHNSPISLYAVDFNMPEGTPVVAARDGTVIQTQDKYTGGGKDPYYADKANYVRILHSDGTTGIYAHLEYEGVTVSPGQFVKAGEVIGYSGSTGFSGGPHLHFAVTHLVKTAEGFDDVSIPISFYVDSPAYVFEPQKGFLIKADYSSPGTDQAASSYINSDKDQQLITVKLDLPEPVTSLIISNLNGQLDGDL